MVLCNIIEADVAVGGDHFETFIVKGDHEGGKAQLHRDKCEVAKKYVRREPARLAAISLRARSERVGDPGYPRVLWIGSRVPAGTLDRSRVPAGTLDPDSYDSDHFSVYLSPAEILESRVTRLSVREDAP